ncbi:MAG: FecR family protein [Sphingobacterium sp.]
MVNKTELLNLLIGYFNNTIGKREFDRLLDQLDSLADHELAELFDQASMLSDPPALTKIQTLRLQVVHQQINKRIDEKEESINPTITSDSRKYPFKKWIAIAACFIALCTTAVLLFKRNDAHSPTKIALMDPNVISPGQHKAIVRIGGREINLDSASNGLLVGNADLRYTDGRQISTIASRAAEKVVISIPRGGQYQLTLSDGTKVWLNSASELSFYPFEQKDTRSVEIKGEAYFEVAKNPKVPFLVHLDDGIVQVLGTKFNVSNYSASRRAVATLVEGKISFRSKAGTVTLHPNQQVIFDRSQQDLTVNDVDAASYIAWKEGIFDFEGKVFEENLEQIARWYDIDIVYSGPSQGVELAGRMSKGVKLTSFIQYIEQNFDLKCQLTSDRKLLIKPKK